MKPSIRQEALLATEQIPSLRRTQVVGFVMLKLSSSAVLLRDPRTGRSSTEAPRVRRATACARLGRVENRTRRSAAPTQWAGPIRRRKHRLAAIHRGSAALPVPCRSYFELKRRPTAPKDCPDQGVSPSYSPSWLVPPGPRQNLGPRNGVAGQE